MQEQINTGRRGRREVHTGDMEIGQSGAILLPNEGPLVREPEEIVLMDAPIKSDYAEQLSFNEDMVTIRLERSSEKHAPTLIDVYVNGVAKWIPVGQSVTIARKYVEVLARSKPDDIETVHGDATEENPQNRVMRYTRAKHPFSVLHDPSPVGFDWLTKIMAER